jgi:hypothetical protein
LRNIQIQGALNEIKVKMTNTPGIENMRTLISTHLTKILMLYGRLHTDYNARYLPVTVNSILLLINELEMIEKKYYGFSDILKENIDRREKYSSVFLIPEELVREPNTKGLRTSMCALASKIVNAYCEEEKKFLLALNDQVSFKTRQTLYARTRRNCDLLQECCPPADLGELQSLRAFCEEKLVEMGAA